ncbi:DUF2142 domain-containing protein [Streptococcus danieliae]|uniref:DUF2142 domain-containing protein n=1 Tax=Streptococcus danieliae TaxID=747656 RepID=UPI0026EF290B|nr:DUF2142 domain-containing protein [Streptococcus danieliae]
MTIMRDRGRFFNGIPAEWLFLMIALVFGLLFILIIPPMTAPDEIGHFAKSYAFSQGKIVPYFLESAENPFKTWNQYGFNLPASISELNQNVIGIGYNPTDKFDYSSLIATNFTSSNNVFVPLGGQLNYSFFQYIPQILAISISKLFASSMLSVYYATRIVNFLSYVFILFLAIKWAKFAKWGFVLLALNPMFLLLATSTSGDAFTNAISFLFVAILSNLISDEEMNKKKLYSSFVLMIMMIQMKPTLIMFGLLYFLIPNKNFSIWSKFLYGISILVSSLVIYYLWGKLFPSQDVMYIDFASPSEQIRFLLEKPLHFVTVIQNTIDEHGEFLFHSYTGKYGLLNRNIPFWTVWVYYLFVVFAVFIREHDQLIVSNIMRLTSIVFLFGYVLLTFIALYQIWSPLGSSTIQGLQGRYFIPSGAFALLAITPNKDIIAKKLAVPIVMSGAVLFLGYVTYFLANSYGFLNL